MIMIIQKEKVTNVLEENPDGMPGEETNSCAFTLQSTYQIRHLIFLFVSFTSA